MNDIYLVNHRPPNCKPLKSIMSLSKNEAFALAKELHKETVICEAYGRFSEANFEAYYET